MKSTGMVIAIATVTVTVIVASALPGCSSRQPNEMVVFAAASLKSTFTQLGIQFEKAYPGTEVRFNFAGSADLVAQLVQGAHADIFASADTENMIEAVDAGLISGPQIPFASNTLTIVTPPGNDRRIASFADLADPGTQVVVCAPQVPCGTATEKLERITAVTLKPVSEESSVAAVLTKIVSGQADAGLVYRTDAAAAGSKVDEVPFAESSSAVNTYPLAILKGSADRSRAHRFVELVTAPTGQSVLAAAGFGPP